MAEIKDTFLIGLTTSVTTATLLGFRSLLLPLLSTLKQSNSDT